MKNEIEQQIFEKMKTKDFGESMCNETKLNVLRWTMRQLDKDDVYEKISNEEPKPPLYKGDVMPCLFFVVEEAEEGVWEQITVGLSTYEEAKAYKERWDDKHPNAFIVVSFL